MAENQERMQQPHYYVAHDPNATVKNFLTGQEYVHMGLWEEENDPSKKTEAHEKYKANPEHPWEYDFKYEYPNRGCHEVEKNHIPAPNKFWNLDEEKDDMKRLLKYRTDYNRYDCDGSGEYGCSLTREIYRKLWDWKAGDKETYGKVGDKGWMAGPETMNSFFTAFRYASKAPRNVKTDKWLYCEIVESQKQLKEVLHKEEDETEWKNFAKYHQTLGNFCLVPAGFNSFRGQQCADFWDRSLFYLKQEAGNSWLNRDDIFTKYINYFFLWDYVKRDGSQYQVRALRKCNFKNDATGIINGDEQSKLTPDETSWFLKNAMWAIRRRGIFMTAMLQLRMDNKQVFKKLRNEVFLSGDCYCGYNTVIGMITNDLTENAKKWLENEPEFAETIRKHEENK